MTSFFYVVSIAFHTSVPALRKCMNTYRKKNLSAESAATPAQDRGESITELMPRMNFLVHSYTCCSDRHASPYWTFIRRWISTGITPSLLKKRMTDPCSSLVHVASGPPSLRYYCAIVLCSCVVLPPAGHSSNHEYHCCQLTRQSSCVSNFYRTFKIFIWLSLLAYNKNLYLMVWAAFM
jgi:hypothetical protein